LAAAAGLALLVAVAAPTAHAQATIQEVGADNLGARGLNSALAIAGTCAYVGSRGQGPVEVVDIAQPGQPRTVGSLGGASGATTRELRAVPDRHLLVVMSYALVPGGANRFDIYHWDTDCGHPQPLGAYDFGAATPHEFYLWSSGSRLLLFTAMFHGGAGALQVIDASDPARPGLAGTWAAPIGSLHSLSLSPDGATAYLALWTGGLLVADASDFTAARPNPALRLVTQPADALRPPPGGNVHSAVQVPGRSLLVLTDERYPPACPFGPARIADISDPAHPRLAATFAPPDVPCGGGTHTSHNPTPTGNLALVTWYSNGLQVFDISDPASPQRVASFQPQGPEPGQRDIQLGVSQSMSWSYPVIRNGLIYLADIDSGLHVLRYQGPHAEEIDRLAFSEGNSNLTALIPTPAPTPSTHPTRAASPSATGSVSGRVLPGWLPWASLIALAVVVGGGGWWWLGRRRRSRPPTG
jgi:hypothetical protein